MKYLLNSPAPSSQLKWYRGWRGQCKEKVIHTFYIYLDNTHTHTVVLISPKLAALLRLSLRDWEYWFCVCARNLVCVCARLCLIGPNWSVKTLPPQSACVCSLLTNMLSRGFVFVSWGLIAASAVCINICACAYGVWLKGHVFRRSVEGHTFMRLCISSAF